MKKQIMLVGFILILVILAGVILFVGRNAAVNNSTSKMKVVATTTQLTDFVKNVAGDKVELATIFNPGVDPHEYEPTPNDIKAITNADLIIQNGVDLEKRMDVNIKSSNAKVVTASDFVNIQQGNEEEPNGDPHIWFSVINAKNIVNAIASALSDKDPVNKSFYTANAASYINALTDLDTYIKNKVAELPLSNRKLVTNHDAFGYYVKEYGFDFVGSVIPSLSTETQPSVQETTDLINKIKEQGVKAIFTESSINPKLAQQIADEANVKIVSNLYGDTLGEQGSNGDTYIKMMKYNTDSIVDNLK